jgi:glycosyltransferase involved in cell wall biosynthesis
LSSVSVIIPTYNGGKFLLDAVNSALQQTYAPLEIIVVDDGSQENILQVLSPVSKRIKYIRQENAGPAAARNTGIRAAKGEFIAFLDDDDLWHPMKTEAQMCLMSQDPDCGLVYSYPVLIDENGSIISNRGPLTFPSGYVYYDFVHHNRIGTPSATLLKASVLNTVGMFDEARECISCEDYDLWLRIAKSHKVVYCDVAITYYRQSSSGISKNIDKHVCSHLYVMNKILEQFINNRTNGDAEFIHVLNTHLYRTYKAFAYSIHYQMKDRIAARLLLHAALRKNPWNPKDILYLILFSLPEWSFEYIRNMKRFFLGPKR